MRRRALILFAVIALVLWLVRAQPRPGREEVGAPWFYSRVSAQGETCCLNGDETDPHQECVNGTCQWVDGCGVTDCANCDSCDPNQEMDCINNGGSWDSATCSCEMSCDPDGSQEANCYFDGGEWDPFSCT